MDNLTGILTYLLAGAIGFLLGELLYYLDILVILSPTDASFFEMVIASAPSGAIVCGISLGIVSKNIMKGIKMAIGGLVGFAIAPILRYPLFLIIAMLMPAWVQEGPQMLVAFFFVAAFGAMGSSFYGIVQLGPKKTAIFMVTGTLGFFVGLSAGHFLFGQGFWAVVVFGLIIGAFLGIGMYYAEKEG